MDLQYVFLCDQAAEDPNGKLDVQGIFHDLLAPGFPAVQERMVLVLVIGPYFVRWLRVNEFGQNIREEGPEGHKTKEGTPTMGGVLIWFAVLIPYVVFSRFSIASLTVLISRTAP